MNELLIFLSHYWFNIACLQNLVDVQLLYFTDLPGCTTKSIGSMAWILPACAV